MYTLKNQYKNNHNKIFHYFPKNKQNRKKIILKHKPKVKSNEFLIFMCGRLFEQHEFSVTTFSNSILEIIRT